MKNKFDEEDSSILDTAKRQINCHMAAASAAKRSVSQTCASLLLWLLVTGAQQSISTIREVLRGGAGCEIKSQWRENMSALII